VGSSFNIFLNIIIPANSRIIPPTMLAAMIIIFIGSETKPLLRSSIPSSGTVIGTK